jgi:hypothetical protein
MVTQLEIQGITPPVAGATPIIFVVDTVTAQYSGTVTWTSKDGPLVGTFQPATIYAATMNLIPNSGFTFTGVGQDSFLVNGASRVYNSGGLGEVTAIFPPQLLDATESLDLAFADYGSINIKDVFGQFPLNEKGLPVGTLKVDQIAVDSQNGIVVLASFHEGGIDNHILLRFNSNGSYDFNFGAPGRSLRRNLEDSRKPFVLVTTTCNTYVETLDLEIDSEDGILVLLSGSSDQNDCGGIYHNFVARYTSAGVLDLEFGDDGAIGTLAPQDGAAISLYVDLTLDDQNRILLAWVSNEDVAEIGLIGFLADGTFDESGDSFGSESLKISYPGGSTPEPYRSVSIIADNANGYIISFTGVGSIVLEDPIYFTQLTRFHENGVIDQNFKGRGDFGPSGDALIVPYFFLTDLAPDGLTGFLVAGTVSFPSDIQNSFAAVVRINLDGSSDNDFSDPTINGDLNPLVSNSCINSGLLRNHLSNQSGNGIVLGNYCSNGAATGGILKTFFSSGEFFGEFFRPESVDFAGQITKQLIETFDGKVVALSGALPTKGFSGYFDSVVGFGDQVDWTQPIISRYEFVPPPTIPLTITGPAQITGIVDTPINSVNLVIAGASGSPRVTVTSGSLPAGLTYTSSGLISGTPTTAGNNSTTFTVTDSSEETATATIQFVISPISVPISVPVIVAPTPVPYLRTLTAPKLNLIDGNLICTPGTYNAGYTLDGVLQGSTTALFTPSAFSYNLLINGIAQTSLTVVSSTPINSWNLPATTSRSLISCSVAISVNGISNLDRSTDNTSAVGLALSTQAASLVIANVDYSSSLTANSKAYQLALVDNRALWRNQIDAIRSNYYDTLNRIKAKGGSKMVTDTSTALKVMIAAQKKSAADYAASKPAALAAKDAADRTVLAARDVAIAKANAAYGTFIESIGYGVLIP